MSTVQKYFSAFQAFLVRCLRTEGDSKRGVHQGDEGPHKPSEQDKGAATRSTPS